MAAPALIRQEGPRHKFIFPKRVLRPLAPEEKEAFVVVDDQSGSYNIKKYLPHGSRKKCLATRVPGTLGNVYFPLTAQGGYGPTHPVREVVGALFLRAQSKGRVKTMWLYYGLSSSDAPGNQLFSTLKSSKRFSRDTPRNLLCWLKISVLRGLQGTRSPMESLNLFWLIICVPYWLKISVLHGLWAE